MGSGPGGGALVRILLEAVTAGARSALRTSGRLSDLRSDRSSGDAQPHPVTAGGYPGDFTGLARVEYRPDPDGDADPGEIVWAWVPYEEDHTKGKDRPVLVVGRDGGWLLALMLTSQDHDRDAAQEARHGRVWQDVGSGAWDARNRPSEVRLDRILRLDPAAVRREGATLDRRRFDDVAAGLRRQHSWP